MAEEVKKEGKKEDKPALVAPKTGISWEEVVLLILGIIALLFVFIPRFFGQGDIMSPTGNVTETYDKVFHEQETQIVDPDGQIIQTVKTPSLLDEGKSRLTDFFKITAIVVFSFLIFMMLLLGAFIYYNKFRRSLILTQYKKKFETEEEQKREDKIDAANENILEKSLPDTNGIVNPKWELIGRYFNSANKSDWKLAIIEADIMLYEVLDKSGFPGDSIGEMLKNTDRSKLHHIDAAWSAHKVRNEIAHSGSDYVLSRDVLEQTIANYERVFDELNFI